MNLSQFLSAYWTNSSQLTNQNLEFKKALNNYQGKAQLNRLSYQFKPYFQKTDYVIPGSTDFTYNSQSLESSINYTLPWATGIELKGNYYLNDNSSESSEQTNYSFSVMMTQPLSRNMFGQMDRRLRDFYYYQKEASKVEYTQFEKKECRAAALSFLRAYHAQEKLLIASEQNKKSIKVWQQAKKNYKRRLINKIDYLVANGDYLASKANRMVYKTEYEQALATLGKYYYEQVGALSSPMRILQELENKNTGAEVSPTITQYQNLVKSKSNYYYHVKSKNRFDITLFAGAGRQKNDVSQSTIGDSRNDYVIAGLAMDFPLLDGDRKLENGNALAEKLIAENNLKEVRLDLKKQYHNLLLEIKTNKDMIDILKEKIMVFKSQVKEAHRKMTSGKIDFKDYIQYRDQYSNERMSFLDQIYALYQKKFTLLLFGNQLPQFCKRTK